MNVPVEMLAVLFSTLLGVGGCQLVLTLRLVRDVAVFKQGLNEVRSRLGLPPL